MNELAKAMAKKYYEAVYVKKTMRLSEVPKVFRAALAEYRKSV